LGKHLQECGQDLPDFLYRESQIAELVEEYTQVAQEARDVCDKMEGSDTESYKTDDYDDEDYSDEDYSDEDHSAYSNYSDDEENEEYDQFDDRLASIVWPKSFCAIDDCPLFRHTDRDASGLTPTATATPSPTPLKTFEERISQDESQDVDRQQQAKNQHVQLVRSFWFKLFQLSDKPTPSASSQTASPTEQPKVPQKRFRLQRHQGMRHQRSLSSEKRTASHINRIQVAVTDPSNPAAGPTEQNAPQKRFRLQRHKGIHFQRKHHQPPIASLNRRARV